MPYQGTRDWTGQLLNVDPLPGTAGPIPLPQDVEKEINKPYRYQPYPAMKYLYVRGVEPMRDPTSTDPEDRAINRDVRQILSRTGFAPDQVATKDTICCIVADAGEAGKLGDLWGDSPADAKARAQQHEADINERAAERNYTDRLMSDKAKAEVAAQDADAGFSHVLDPVVPKKRGRPKKVEQG